MSPIEIAALLVAAPFLLLVGSALTWAALVGVLWCAVSIEQRFWY